MPRPSEEDLEAALRDYNLGVYPSITAAAKAYHVVTRVVTKQ